jgi:hypothetical protein
VCEQLGIKSQNDKVKLEEAKHRTYLKGFTDGVMLLGAFKAGGVLRTSFETADHHGRVQRGGHTDA